MQSTSPSAVKRARAGASHDFERRSSTASQSRVAFFEGKAATIPLFGAMLRSARMVCTKSAAGVTANRVAPTHIPPCA